MSHEQMIANLATSYEGLKAQLRLNLLTMEEANLLVRKLNEYSIKMNLGLVWKEFDTKADFQYIYVPEDDPYFNQNNETSWDDAEDESSY